jgi:hypothetical protein
LKIAHLLASYFFGRTLCNHLDSFKCFSAAIKEIFKEQWYQDIPDVQKMEEKD